VDFKYAWLPCGEGFENGCRRAKLCGKAFKRGKSKRTEQKPATWKHAI